MRESNGQGVFRDDRETSGRSHHRSIGNPAIRSGLTGRHRLAGLAFAAALVVRVADAQLPSEVTAAAATVTRQLEAFRRGDFDAAYGFASTSIKEIFDRPTFETMVRRGYPEIAQSTSAVVTGGDVGADGHVHVRLTIHGANGRSVDAVYDMVQEGSDWRIDGVVARPTTGTI